jgi:hypothetical protein
MSTIRVTVSRKLLTDAVASASVHVAANPSPATPKTGLGYSDFNIPRGRLDAFWILVRTNSRDRVGRESSSSGADCAISKF